MKLIIAMFWGLVLWAVLLSAAADALAAQKEGKESKRPRTRSEIEAAHRATIQAEKGGAYGRIERKYSGIAAPMRMSSLDKRMTEKKLFRGMQDGYYFGHHLDALMERREPREVWTSMFNYLLSISPMTDEAGRPIGHAVEHAGCDSSEGGSDCLKEPMPELMNCMLVAWPGYVFESGDQEKWIAVIAAEQEKRRASRRQVRDPFSDIPTYSAEQRLIEIPSVFGEPKPSTLPVVPTRGSRVLASLGMSEEECREIVRKNIH